MKVLVTGATGFVGKAIVEKLSETGFDVLSAGRRKLSAKENTPNFIQLDITDVESLENLKALKNIDVIIHSAGLAHQFGKVDNDKFREVNVEGTKNIGKVAVELNVKHFILISSVSVYGSGKNTIKPIDEEFICKPSGAYAQSKFYSEKAAIQICEKNKIPLTILRLATVIGENDSGNTQRLIKAIDNGKFCWIGKGENYKSLVYKEDVARACLAVIKKKTSKTEIFNVTAEPLKMKEIVSEIASLLNKNIPKFHLPISILEKIFYINSRLLKTKKISDVSNTIKKWLSEDVFSGNKIITEYHFRAETSVREAISRQVKAYKHIK
jgi:nucleoside-diphosphate-sugar epimerase